MQYDSCIIDIHSCLRVGSKGCCKALCKAWFEVKKFGVTRTKLLMYSSPGNRSAL